MGVVADRYRAWRLRPSARRHVRAIKGQLIRDYGVGDRSVKQFVATVTKLGLPARDRSLGLAAFLSAEDFVAAGGTGDYAALRGVAAPFLGDVPTETFHEALPNAHAMESGPHAPV